VQQHPDRSSQILGDLGGDPRAVAFARDRLVGLDLHGKLRFAACVVHLQPVVRHGGMASHNVLDLRWQQRHTADDELPVTDQNLELVALHPDLVVHKIYPATGHAAFRERPDWVIRDATQLLQAVKRRPARTVRR